jgi:hypothetical protein
MSEPYQLIGKIYGDKKNLIKQRQTIIEPASIYKDWGLMSNIPENSNAIAALIDRAYSGKSFNELWQIYFNKSPFNGVEIDRYNETENCWEFLLFFFSETYIDFITVFNGLRQIGSQSAGTIAVLPYMYGKGFDDAIILDITENTSTIRTTVDQAFKGWATDWLNWVINSQQQIED